MLIAGPSSSGKTTFSKRLAVQLLANGIRPFAIELDNYFVDRDHTPRDEQGDYDFEALDALDLELFNQQLLQLMAGEEVTLPRFNFVTGQREAGETVQLGPDQILIVEGIHGLNPRLVPDIPAERIFRIYVSALTQLNLDRHNRVPTTDTRLLRRIVRDAEHRGYSAEDTIDRWESVRQGERKYIFPYQENADVMFNSALVYELAVLKPLAEPLLLQIEPGTPEYVEAKRLLAFLQWFEPIPPDPIPDNSLLREFIGGSTWSVLSRGEDDRRANGSSTRNPIFDRSASPVIIAATSTWFILKCVDWDEYANADTPERAGHRLRACLVEARRRPPRSERLKSRRKHALPAGPVSGR